MKEHGNSKKRPGYSRLMANDRRRCQRLALAQIRDCDFWTADERLINSLRGGAPFVKWIGDFDSGPGG